MRLALIAGRSTSTSKALTQALIDGAVWEELTPPEALASRERSIGSRLPVNGART